MTMEAYALSPLKRVFVAQLAATIVLASALALFDPVVAYSAIMGGMIYGIANAYAARRIFSPKKLSCPQGELYRMYRAEFAKLVMIGALCAAVFAGIEQINIIAFIVGCGCAMIAGAIGALTQPMDYGAEEVGKDSLF